MLHLDYLVSNHHSTNWAREQLEGLNIKSSSLRVIKKTASRARAFNHFQGVLSCGVAGALVGLGIALLIMLVMPAWFSNGVGAPALWLLAALVVGFCTWEGGLIGIQRESELNELEEACHKGAEIMRLRLSSEDAMKVIYLFARREQFKLIKI